MWTITKSALATHEDPLIGKLCIAYSDTEIDISRAMYVVRHTVSAAAAVKMALALLIVPNSATTPAQCRALRQIAMHYVAEYRTRFAVMCPHTAPLKEMLASLEQQLWQGVGDISVYTATIEGDEMVLPDDIARWAVDFCSEEPHEVARGLHDLAARNAALRSTRMENIIHELGVPKESIHILMDPQRLVDEVHAAAYDWVHWVLRETSSTIPE